MFLKTLTVKGFKSFADPTTLELQPGITVVVGPNGSGKSNIVDAVAWVLGAQGPRTLRSAKMDDVIFAGSSDRPGLGRAEVTLTIDNSARLLPVDLPEVSFTRTLFRSGESEYALNGAACRLLDIQELLYDSGVGRQQHVIVSQGQLDTVLNSRPEDRRLLIEEAAGILKYRKRRERAERRLEATEGNLLRLQDLLAELRRQARPLERQAEAARHHGGLVEEAQALRRFVAGQELSALAARLETTLERNSELATAERAAVAELARLNDEVGEGEAAASHEHAEDLSDAVARMSGLRERARGLAALLAEKHRSVERQLAGFGDEAMAAHLAQDAQRLRGALEAVDSESGELVELDRKAAEAEAAVEEERSAFASRWAHVGDGSTTSAEVRGELTALRRSVEQGRAGMARLESRQAELQGRTDTLDEEVTSAELEVASARRARDAFEAELESAHDRRVLAEERLRVEAEQADSVRRRAQSAAARSEALAQALAEAAGDEDHAAHVEGALGRLRDLLDVDPGWEGAVYAALGEALSAVAVSDVEAARSALGQLSEGGRPGVVLVLDAPLPPAEPRADAGALGADPVRAHVRSGSPGVEPLLDVLLAPAVATDNWQAAIDTVLARPHLVVVTRNGDRFGPTGWRAAGGARSMELALEQARSDATEAAGALAESEKTLAAARYESEGAQQVLADVERRMAEQEARLRDASASLARLRAERRQVEVELEALSSHLAYQARRMADEETRAARLESDLSLLDAEEARLAQWRAERLEAERHVAERAAAARALRRDVEVRAAALQERRELLTRELREVESRAERLQRGKDMVGGLQVRARATSRLTAMVGHRLVGIEESMASMQERRRREQAARREASERLAVLRRERGRIEQRLEELRAEAREVQLEEAEARVRIESLEESVGRDLGCAPQVAMAAECPELPAGVAAGDRLQELERQLRAMGPVNPLALEEHKALQERQRFLHEQLEDVRAGRRELAKVIRSIDEEIIQVFSAAYADVAENFTKLFATLFPGGSGSLHLTDPDNLLEAGVEVEARPAGKNVRRLSLLSGGERSLTALAFLFAVFRSRPSPFYLLDEVEAALDDVNLQRFLRLLDEFRQEAQLLVVTHQKRTMEAADCLYGVTMQPGGSSRVVSERVATPAGR